MSPSFFDSCEILERIGEGGSADVFHALRKGRDVAIKVLRDPERAGHRKRFLREGHLLRRLSHPGLVRCLEVIDEDQPAIVLELLRGETLNVRVARGPMSGDEAVLLASSVLRSLAFLHERGIVHRDVKASNIFLADDRRVVLMDLGLAADPGDPLATTLGDVLGTHAYMAPEQIAGAETDHRCDLYSLGITLYEALCGARPYQARGLASYLKLHRTGGARPVVEAAPHTPVRLAALVDRLMARDPAARPASAAVALAQLTGSAGIRRDLERPALVGRQGTRGALNAVVEVGGVLRIEGELGSGLGAVARLALRIARRDRLEYVTLRCRSRVGLPETIAALARELDAVCGPVAPVAGAIHAAVAGMVGEGGRFLVVVEDLDLGPPGLPDLLAQLATIRGLVMVVTGTLLPDAPAGRSVTLRPLRPAEVRVLVGSMLGSATVPAGLDAALCEVTGGLPALVVALLREQVARGAAWCEGAGDDGSPKWAWDPSVRLAPGEDASRLFHRALNFLTPAARLLVHALAVAGEPVPLDVLLDATGVEPSGADLGPALRGGLCVVSVEHGEEWVALRRAVLEPLIISAIDPFTRRQLHLALATSVRARSTGDWERRFLFLHDALGSRAPAATQHLVELGDWLVSGGRPVDGLDALDEATQLPLDDPRGLALLALARGDALRALSRLPEARAAVTAGRELAAEARDAALEARGDLSSFELYQCWGFPPPSEVAEAITAAARERPSARGFLLLGEERRRAGDLTLAQALAEQANSHAAPGPVDRVGVAARILLGRIACGRGALAEAGVILRGVATELRQVDRVHGAGEALALLADVHRLEGNLSASDEALRVADGLVRGRGLPWMLAHVSLLFAALHLACGDTAGAAEIARSQASCGEGHAPWTVRLAYLELLGELRTLAGDMPAALALHLRVVEAAEAAGDEPIRAFHAGMAAILTADAVGVSVAMEALRALHMPRPRALLLAAGARGSASPDLLRAALAEARDSGDRLLLLSLLHALRESPAEAREICEDAIHGLHGGLRVSFLDRPDVVWALG